MFSKFLNGAKLYFSLGLILGILFSYGVYSVVSMYTSYKHKLELSNLEKVLNTKCSEDQKKSQGVSNEYQKKLTSTNAKLNDALRRLRNSERKTDDRTSSGYNATSGDGRLYYADPTGAVPSLERAAIATKQAEQLIACQNFILEERR